MDIRYCSFCDMEAEHLIEETWTPICSACKQVYKAGQASHLANIAELPDEDVLECLKICSDLRLGVTLDNLKDPNNLRKRANEYTREGEYYESVEPDELLATGKYGLAEALEKLATAIENA